MATVLDLMNALKAFDLKATVVRVMQDNAKQVVMLNQAQMLHGKKATGEQIGKYSSSPMGREYAEIKSQMNSLAGKGNVDLKFSGSFYRGMNFKINGLSYVIKSTDWKNDHLSLKYGDDIFGLTLNNWQTFIEAAFLPDFFFIFNRETGLSPN